MVQAISGYPQYQIEKARKQRQDEWNQYISLRNPSIESDKTAERRAAAASIEAARGYQENYDRQALAQGELALRREDLAARKQAYHDQAAAAQVSGIAQLGTAAVMVPASYKYLTGSSLYGDIKSGLGFGREAAPGVPKAIGQTPSEIGRWVQTPGGEYVWTPGRFEPPQWGEGLPNTQWGDVSPASFTLSEGTPAAFGAAGATETAPALGYSAYTTGTTAGTLGQGAALSAPPSLTAPSFAMEAAETEAIAGGMGSVAGEGTATSIGAGTIATGVGAALVGSAFGEMINEKYGSLVGGAIGGALYGTYIFPGIGTVVGFILGGIVGALRKASVVCEELYSQGAITKKELLQCYVFKKKYVPDHIYEGYLVWGEWIVRQMQKGGWRNALLKPVMLSLVHQWIATAKGKKGTLVGRGLLHLSHLASWACWKHKPYKVYRTVEVA